MFALVSGYVKVVVTGVDGRDVLFTVLGPGEVFGEVSALDGAPRSASVTALEATEVLVIDRHALVLFLRSSSEAAVRLLAVLAARLRRLSAEREDIASLDVPTRLAKRIFDLAARYGEPEREGGQRIALRLSQQELGAWVGVTRESVNRFLRKCSEDGLLRFDAGRILVRDMEGLERLASGQ